MTVKKSNKWSIVAIGSTIGAVLAIWAFADKASAEFKEKYLIPVIDCRHDEKQKISDEKLDVIYMFNMEKAKIDGNIDLWNRCVDNVQNKGRINRIRNK